MGSADRSARARGHVCEAQHGANTFHPNDSIPKTDPPENLRRVSEVPPLCQTPENLQWILRLLGDSYAAAGPHLHSIIDEDHRLDATGVVAKMGAIRVMTLATTTARGDPRVGPADELLHRGLLHFGSRIPG